VTGSTLRHCCGVLIATILTAGSSLAKTVDKPATPPRDSSAGDDARRADERDLAFTVAPIAAPVRAGKTPILIGLENRSKYPLRFSLAEEWVKGFSFSYRDKEGHPAGGGGSGQATTYDWAPGTKICHLAASLLVLPPGGTIFRGAEVDLSRVNPGTITLTVKVQLMQVPADFTCAHTRLLSGEASQVIEVAKSSKQ
jgi:hypothetical protein